MPRRIARSAAKSHLDLSAKDHHIRVDLGPRSYDIQVESGLLHRLGRDTASKMSEGSASGRTAVVLSNPKIDLYLGQTVRESLESEGFRVLQVTIAAGECYKTLQTVRRIYAALYAAAVDRRTVLVALGGGVIGDIGGFVASSYNRGLDLVQVPTTLLAQVDSSVGGKTGVNFSSGKNLIGAFYQPKFVAIDPSTLQTLPLRERRSGLVEMVKYGIIYDTAFFDLLEREAPAILRLRSNFLSYCIARSCQIKAEVVEKDERDDGLRAILNFGHTIGHAVEAITRYRVYRHGEAIAIGMISACLIGEEMGITAPEDTQRIAAMFQSAGFPVAMQEHIPLEGIVELLSWDKKSVNGSARFVLMHRIGHVSPGHCVDPETLMKALERQRVELRTSQDAASSTRFS